jgi:hypothetical protein
MTTIKKERKLEYRQIVLNSTREVEYLNQFNNAGPILWLAEQIRGGKRNLKYNSVDFIIGKLLTKDDRLINYQKRDFINIYVIGTFRSEFIPTMKVADALAEFYLEMRIMPNIITISRKEFLDNLRFSINKIRNGIIIYDRERNLH